MYYTLIKHENGLIKCIYRSTLDVVLANVKETDDYIIIDCDVEQANASTHYVKNNELLARPENPAKLNGTTLNDVPVPSEIFINGTRYQCDEETVELDLEEGVHEVIIKSFPYKERVYEINTQK